MYCVPYILEEKGGDSMILCKIRTNKDAETAWRLDIPYWISDTILNVATVQEARRIATGIKIPEIPFKYYPLIVDFEEL